MVKIPTDIERHKLYAELMRSGTRIDVQSDKSKLMTFIETMFFLRRMIVVKVSAKTKGEAGSNIRAFAENRDYEFEVLKAKELTADDIRGKVEIIYQNGTPYHTRVKPSYWPKNKRKVIMVEGIDQQTDTEVLRAFLYVACLGGGYDRNNLPQDQLPNESGFIFLADDGFPADKFDSISEYWREESVVYDNREKE